MGNEDKITVRLKPEASVNLSQMVDDTGYNKSFIINELLIQSDNVWIIDGKKLAYELQKLRLLAERPMLSESDRCQLSVLCRTATGLLYDILRKGDE